MCIYVPAVSPASKIEMIIVRSSVRLASASAVMHISVLASESPGLEISSVSRAKCECGV